MLALLVVAVHQLTSMSSVLSDAGNWAAIVAAAILVAGLIFGWFTKVGHALHVVGENVGLHVRETASGDIEIILGLDLLNTAPVALSYEIVDFKATLGEHPEAEIKKDATRAYIAPQQRIDWHGEPQPVWAISLPLTITARYEVQYGRKSRRWWWWRRSLRGGFKAELPLSPNPMTLLAEPLDGPVTDERVPLTSWGIFRVAVVIGPGGDPNARTLTRPGPCRSITLADDCEQWPKGTCSQQHPVSVGPCPRKETPDHEDRSGQRRGRIDYCPPRLARCSYQSGSEPDAKQDPRPIADPRSMFTGRVRGVAIHEEQVGDYRGRFERFLDLHRSHRHRVIRRTWTLDDSLWADDPNALEFCECGAVRRLWGINNPWWRPQ